MYCDHDDLLDLFSWDQCFVTGLPEIDAQHQRLVEISNQLGSLIMQGPEVHHDAISEVLQTLSTYASFHFNEEEAMMHRVGLNNFQIARHREDHVNFLKEVEKMYAEVFADNPDTPRLIFKFLTNWLVFHILGVDMFMARQVSAIMLGHSTTEGAAVEEPLYGGPVKILLNAMHELYRQLAERNITLNELNLTLEAKVEERTEQLSRANGYLEEMAMTDVLTGLPNRRYALRSLGQEWTKSQRSGTHLSCLIIDTDDFKRINDSFGHDAGDEVLRVLSRQISASTRSGDDVCRLGGDEFLVICPNTTLEVALQIAERIRLDVAELQVHAGNDMWNGSCSIGVASRTQMMMSQDDVIKVADKGLYLAKGMGRNCVASIQTRELS
jgi:hemerythrin